MKREQGSRLTVFEFVGLALVSAVLLLLSAVGRWR